MIILTENTIDKLKGQYCNIIITELGKKKPSVIFGFLKDFDHKREFIIIESSDGLEIVNKSTVVAIKPTKKK